MKTDILPLLDDDSMGELDEEVNMISKRMPDCRSSEGGSGEFLSQEGVQGAIKREEEGFELAQKGQEKK